MTFIPYTRQSIESEDIQAVSNSLLSDAITRGSQTQEFEKQIASYCQVKHAVCFNNGTSALSAAGYAVKICASDHIVTSPNTFVGTVAYALKKASYFSLSDIDETTGCSDFTNIANKGLRTVLFPVHFSGIAKKIVKQRADTIIIEDACQAFGSQYSSGEMVGSCPESDLTIFSFHPAKTITCGEGGCVTTNNPKYYERLLLFRNNGIKRNLNPLKGYEVHDLTDNYHLTDFQAALGLSQLYKITPFLQKRRQLVSRYRQNLKDNPHIKLFTDQYDLISAHNLFVIQIDFDSLNISKEELRQKLIDEKIGTQVHFIPLYRHPYFIKKFGTLNHLFPKMESYFNKALTLPLYYDLTMDQVDRICNQLITITKNAALNYIL